jgi:hypothetical protein
MPSVAIASSGRSDFLFSFCHVPATYSRSCSFASSSVADSDFSNSMMALP